MFFVEKCFFLGNGAVTGLEIRLDFFFGGGMVGICSRASVGLMAGSGFVLGFGVALARFGKMFCRKMIFFGQWGCDGFGN